MYNSFKNRAIKMKFVIGAMLIVVLFIMLNKFSKPDMISTETIEITKFHEDYYDENGNYHHYYEVIPYTENYGYGDNREIACILLNDEREKWDYIPLTDSFRKKYSNKRIIDDDNIIKFSMADDEMMQSLELEENDEYEMSRISCTKTDGKYAYIFDLDLNETKNYINDIHILRVVKLYDNTSGYTDDYYIKFNRENYITIFESIMFPGIKPQGDLDISRHNVALTKNFLDKYGYDKDIIENTTGVPLTRFTLSDEDFDNRTFTCSCLYKAINLWKKYEIKFSLTEDGQLETIDNNIKNK